MSELGQYLKEKREQKGYSIEQLQELTKIQKRYLTAIEEGRHEALPGAFYARAFVKSYSEALGLNADEILDTYGRELPQPKQQTVDLPSRRERSRPKVNKKRKKSNILPALMGILFMVVVAAGIYLVVQSAGESSSSGVSPEEDPTIEMDSNEQDTDEEATAEEQEEEPVEEGTESDENTQEEEQDKPEDEKETMSPELISSENRRSTYDVSQVSEMILELDMNGNSYLDVKDRNGNIIEDLSGIEAGETVELDVSEEDYVQLNIGNSTAVTVRFNGEEINYPIDAVHQYLIFDKNVQ